MIAISHEGLRPSITEVTAIDGRVPKAVLDTTTASNMAERAAQYPLPGAALLRRGLEELPHRRSLIGDAVVFAASHALHPHISRRQGRREAHQQTKPTQEEPKPAVVHVEPFPALPPQNTIVVLPKPLPMNRSALWTLFWTTGILMGLFAREVIDGPGRIDNSGTAGSQAMVASSSNGAPTMEVHVRAVLELPSPTATSTPRPSPTATPDPAGQANFCTDAEPGKLCKVPFPPPPTPTPYPSCEEMDQLSPGDWCVWPTRNYNARRRPR